MNTTALFTLISCGTALAGNIDVTSDVISSETWTADNTYNLTQQIYVRPGATLTIEAGTRIVSTATANGSGHSASPTVGSCLSMVTPMPQW